MAPQVVQGGLTSWRRPGVWEQSLNDTSDPQLIGRLMLFARELAREVGIADQGYRVVVNTNPDGGQTVFHLHLHVLGGRPMTWPPG